MIELLGYIPHSAQGLYKKADKYYTISAPYQKFSINKLPDGIKLKQLGYVKQNALFKKFLDLTKYLENLHMLEIMMNKRMKAAHKLLAKESKKIKVEKISVDNESTILTFEPDSSKAYVAVKVKGKKKLEEATGVTKGKTKSASASRSATSNKNKAISRKLAAKKSTSRRDRKAAAKKSKK